MPNRIQPDVQTAGSGAVHWRPGLVGQLDERQQQDAEPHLGSASGGTKRPFVGTVADMLQAADTNGDGTLDKQEAARLLKNLKSNLIVAHGLVAPEDPEVAEAEMTKDVLKSLANTMRERQKRRTQYRKLMRALLFAVLYFVILFFQRDPTKAYEVLESLTTLVPAGSVRSPQAFGSKEQAADWLKSVVFPTWNDPVCGDGICTSPQEYPAFGARVSPLFRVGTSPHHRGLSAVPSCVCNAGSFGCLADCGAYRQQLLSRVRVQLQAAYISNDLTTPILQATFLETTFWNLCFLSNDTGVPAERCWYPSDQRFASVKDAVNRTLLLPDADWTLVVKAPLGSVTGQVYLLQNGTSRLLASMTRCKARESYPGPLFGFSNASAFTVRSPPPPGRPPPIIGVGTIGSGTGGGGRRLTSAPAAPFAAPSVLADLPHPASLHGAFGRISAGTPSPFLQSAGGAGSPRAADAAGSVPRGEPGAPSHAEGCAQGPGGSGTPELPTRAAWERQAAAREVTDPSLTELQMELQKALGKAAAASPDGSTGTRRATSADTPSDRRKLATDFDLAGSGIIISPTGFSAAVDVESGTRVHYRDWRGIIAESNGTLSSLVAAGALGEPDIRLDVSVNPPIGGPTAGCKPGTDVYTLLKVPKGYQGGYFVSWELVSAVTGRPFATSAVTRDAVSAEGEEGSGYNLENSGDVWFLERWCATSPAVMTAPVTLTLSTSAAAAGAFRDEPLEVTFSVLNKQRCRLAPAPDAGPLFRFPKPGASFTTTLSSLVVPCTPNTKKELEPASIYNDFSWNIYTARHHAPTLILGTKAGSDLDGYISNTAVFYRRPGESCPPLYAPQITMQWFPKSSDSIAWHASLLLTQFDYLQLTGNSSVPVGFMPTFSSFNVNARDGLNEPDPNALKNAMPHGVIQTVCSAYGIYVLRAKQVFSPKRAGRFYVTNDHGCSTVAALPYVDMTGAAYENQQIAFIAAGAWGQVNGSVTSIAFGGQCEPGNTVLSLDSATPGWDGCTERGGVRIMALWLGISVYHASDVSWRVVKVAPDGTMLPTLMSGDRYEPHKNRADDWCMRQGSYRMFMYDSNVASSRNGSLGWDGGSVGIAEADGCIINGNAVSVTEAHAGADIHEATFDFIIGPEGSCTVFANSSAAVAEEVLGAGAQAALWTLAEVSEIGQHSRADGGLCGYDLDALKACQYRSKSAEKDVTSLFSGVKAITATCRAICATSRCDAAIFAISGPVPIDFGCCDQEAGEVRKPFGLWQNHAPGEDYGLIPQSVNDAKQRFVALNNRVVGGLLIEQTRRHKAACTGTDRFQKLSTQCFDSTLSRDPYGVDPVFVSSSTLFDPSVAPEAFYNESEIGVRGLPYGFFPTFDDTFGVFLDVNADEDRARATLQYLVDGYFIDGSTLEVIVTMVTYNERLRVFSLTEVTLEFTGGGEISVSSIIDTVKVELYSSTQDFVRAALEVAFILNLIASIRQEIVDLIDEDASERMRRLFSAGSMIDAVNFAVSAGQVVFWVDLVFGALHVFEIEPRYVVYKDLRSKARFFKVDGDGMDVVRGKFAELGALGRMSTVYIMLHGLNIIFLLGRFLKLCHFQPKLGIISRTLAQASGNLGHYFVVLIAIFFGCAAMTNLVFGPHVEQFSTLGRSFQSCFNMLAMQDSGFSEVFYNMPTPLNIPALFFYWSYVALMTIVMINVALAVIIDAFAAAKNAGANSLAVHQEVANLCKYGGFVLGSGFQAFCENPFPNETVVAERMNKMAREAARADALRANATRRLEAGSISQQGGSSRGSFALSMSHSIRSSISSFKTVWQRTIIGQLFAAVKSSNAAIAENEMHILPLKLGALAEGEPDLRREEHFKEEELTRMLEPFLGKTKSLCGTADAGRTPAEAAKVLSHGLMVILGERVNKSAEARRSQVLHNHVGTSGEKEALTDVLQSMSHMLGAIQRIERMQNKLVHTRANGEKPDQPSRKDLPGAAGGSAAWSAMGMSGGGPADSASGGDLSPVAAAATAHEHLSPLSPPSSGASGSVASGSVAAPAGGGCDAEGGGADTPRAEKRGGGEHSGVQSGASGENGVPLAGAIPGSESHAAGGLPESPQQQHLPLGPAGFPQSVAIPGSAAGAGSPTSRH